MKQIPFINQRKKSKRIRGRVEFTYIENYKYKLPCEQKKKKKISFSNYTKTAYRDMVHYKLQLSHLLIDKQKKFVLCQP